MNIDEKKFKEKYDLYANDLYIISYGYLNSKDDALDIVQDVFLKYLDYDKAFKDLNHEKYWLIRVTINLCKDYLRKKKRIITDDEYISNLGDKKSNQDILKYEIGNLPQKYKDVIILYYYKSYSVKQIADALKISDSNVRKRLERARNILKERIECYEIR